MTRTRRHDRVLNPNLRIPCGVCILHLVREVGIPEGDEDVVVPVTPGLFARQGHQPDDQGPSGPQFPVPWWVGI